MIKLPYGISDFKRVKEDGFYYVDKTHFIPKIENMESYLFFIGPRRFGKSLLLSMLECYYDLRYKGQFSSIFKNTYILNNPTKEANTYHILRFDFSAIDPSNPRESMNNYCNIILESFINSYELAIKLKDSSFLTNLNTVLTYFKDKYLNKFNIIFISITNNHLFNIVFHFFNRLVSI